MISIPVYSHAETLLRGERVIIRWKDRHALPVRARLGAAVQKAPDCPAVPGEDGVNIAAYIARTVKDDHRTLA
jgi:hypothetical protein